LIIMQRISQLLLPVAAVIVMAAFPLHPQAAAQGPSFEAASIREHTGPLRVMKGLTISGTLVTMEGYNLFALVQEAYGRKGYEIAYAGQPLPSIYDIMARASGDKPLTKASMQAMLQTLVIERFRLKVHSESREIPVYVLTIAKSGPKLKESSSDSECHSLIGPVRAEDRNYRYSYTHCPLTRLVDSLSVDRPVIDGTALTGTYDMTLSATPEFRLQNSSDPGDVSVFDVLQSELGLRLEPRKAPVDVLIIDHAEGPLEN
jgi:uncharacterized protein (TIGR03435 family)